MQENKPPKEGQPAITPNFTDKAVDVGGTGVARVSMERPQQQQRKSPSESDGSKLQQMQQQLCL